MRWQMRLALFLAALWWGSLTSVAGLAVPVLWHAIPVASLARPVVVRMLEAQSWLALACGMLILLLFKARANGPSGTQAWAMTAGAALGMLCALLLQFSIAPRVMAAPEIRIWWLAGAALLLLQWVCAATLLWRAANGRENP